MFIRNEQLRFSPSDLITFMESAFDSWMERRHVEFPGSVEVDAIDAGIALLQREGNTHEDNFLAVLIEAGKDVAVVEDGPEAAEQTLLAMQTGREVIYQANLSCGQFGGKADFLMRVDRPSKLGTHSYEAWDTKLARKSKPYFIVQLCCYSEMLARIQGHLPQTIKVVLGDLSLDEFRVADYFDFYRQLKRSFLRFHRNFCVSQPPDCLPGSYSRWTAYAERVLEERDHLRRVANIRQQQILRLTETGINTMTALSECSSETTVPKLSDETFQTLRRQAQLQLQTKNGSTTAYEVLPLVPGKGLTVLPPASKGDVFFDMEGYPYAKDGGLEYLFGVVYDLQGQPTFKDWWAHSPSQEKSAFEQFIDWIYARWRQDPGMHIYHYANYELAAVRKLAGKHSTRVEQVDELLRAEKFVDLYKIVKQSLRVGESSYSIKSIEHLFRPKREGTVSTAMDSVVFYDSWCQQPDGQDWQTSAILKEIRQYNEIDCISTQQLAQWLWQQQKQFCIIYSGKQASLPPPARPISQEAKLAASLLEKSIYLTPPDQQVQVLLAHLLEFHKREDKPMWWRMFDRQTMSPDELYEDLDVLADLQRTNRPPVIIRRSKGYEYRFDPNQDFKLEAGDTCLMVHNLEPVKVEFLNRDKGLAVIVVSTQKQAPPDRISIMRNDYVQSGVIQKAIFKVVSGWAQTRQLPPALDTLLRRVEPSIEGRLPGTPVTADQQLNSIVDAVNRMQKTTLCIQGPPGTGKTYTASHAIVDLVEKGKRVGITSNSHKAIDKLLSESAALAQRRGVSFKGIKVGPTGIKTDGYQPGPTSTARNTAQFLQECQTTDFDLVAGTAWLFSHPDVEHMFDYLFVDEAGQVSLANVVGMSMSADNLVLVGDQMQLEQPIQGSHPGASGQSCLQYLLQEQSTVPANVGIFLNTSWRMHSTICEVISEAVYDGRLQAHQGNDQRSVETVASAAHLLPGNAGIFWLPVEHSGNTQSSLEEVAAIKTLVDQLLQSDLKVAGQSRKIVLKDILVVTPYNMQARMISEDLPGIRVASVDKFQGQEAPIVILSMCCSDANLSPRGMQFIFSKSRLNVAISRAQVMAIVVGSPQLLETSCSSLEQMELLNFFAKIVEKGTSLLNPTWGGAGDEIVPLYGDQTAIGDHNEASTLGCLQTLTIVETAEAGVSMSSGQNDLLPLATRI